MKTITTVLLLTTGLCLLTRCEKVSELPIDADGNRYDTVVIGTQIWFKENLKTTKYNDGKPIPLITNNDEWASTKTGAYCYINNDPDKYKNIYGALYNWYTVETEKLCPIDWHVPTDEDYIELINYLGDFPGTKLKEVGIEHWHIPNNGNNLSGFTALPGGMRSRTGDFSYFGQCCYLWSATEKDSTAAHGRVLETSDSYFGQSGWTKTFGFSIRCIKDE
jgi:uncharacterized protein (TIGR02145 family)